MFGMSWSEIAIVLVVGMFVLGPERIPVAVKWVSSTLKSVRTMAAGAQEQLRGEFGPEIDELRRQIADLQSLKEIQELRSLRDLNPRNLITKNILGEDFSGGVSGFLGLGGFTDAMKATGSGAAPEAPVSQPVTLEKPTTATAVEASLEPVQLRKEPTPESAESAATDPARSELNAPIRIPPVHVNEPNAPRHAAAASFDADAT